MLSSTLLYICTFVYFGIYALIFWDEEVVVCVCPKIYMPVLFVPFCSELVLYCNLCEIVRPT